MHCSEENCYIDIEGTFIHATEKAILLNTGDTEKWIPKSVIFENNDMLWETIEKGDLIEISIPEWFASKNEFI